MKNQFKTIFYYVLIGLFTTQFLVVNVIAGEKKVIEKLDDLPKHTYEIQSTVSELIVSEELFKLFAKKVGDDVASILEEYEINDNTTLKSLQSTLHAIDY